MWYRLFQSTFYRHAILGSSAWNEAIRRCHGSFSTEAGMNTAVAVPVYGLKEIGLKMYSDMETTQKLVMWFISCLVVTLTTTTSWHDQHHIGHHHHVKWFNDFSSCFSLSVSLLYFLTIRMIAPEKKNCF